MTSASKDNEGGALADPRLLTVVGASALLVALVFAHVEPLNGPSYWSWTWRSLATFRVYLLLLPGTLPFLAAFSIERRSGSTRIALVLLMLALLTLQLGAVALHAQPLGLDRIPSRVHNHNVTGYFTEATEITEIGPWLATYPERMFDFEMHATNKPPGPILFFLAFVRMFPEFSAAFVSGLAIGLLSTLAVPLTYLLILATGGTRRAAFRGAAFLTLTPGMVLLLPQVDQLYVVVIAALCLSWVQALQRDDWRFALVFGAVLGAVTFLAFHLLTVGMFLVGYTLWFVIGEPSRRARRVARLAAIGLAVPIVFNAVLWITTRYDALATFRTALEHHALMQDVIDRPYPRTVLFDLTDFLLGTGWIGLLLIGSLAARRATTDEPSNVWIIALAVITPVTVAVTGRVPGETARTWLFMLPLWVLPIAREMDRWSFRSCLAVNTCLWLLTGAICRNMTFFMLKGE